MLAKRGIPARFAPRNVSDFDFFPQPLELVANLADEFVALGRVLGGFDAVRRVAVNYAQNSAAMPRVRDDRCV